MVAILQPHRDVAQLGTFSSTAGGGVSEKKGVAAVKIWRTL